MTQRIGCWVNVHGYDILASKEEIAAAKWRSASLTLEAIAAWTDIECDFESIDLFELRQLARDLLAKAKGEAPPNVEMDKGE